MSPLMRGAIPLALFVSLLSVSGARAQPRPVAPAPAPPDERASENDAAMARALEGARSRGWSDLRLQVECRLDGDLPSVEIFGTGVGIWDREAQFRLEPDQIEAHLQAIEESGFAAWPRRFGGKGGDLPVENQPPRVLCRVVLELDGVHKQVAQLQLGDQSEELRTLAHGILMCCQEQARTGVTAADLNDGLKKIAAGELAPETFSVMVNRRGGGDAADEETWLMRIEGRRASSREGGMVIAQRELDPEEFTALVRDLARADLPGLPPNLYQDQYTDVVVKVLNRRAQINARRFAGMTAETHGSKQERFDTVLEQLRALQRRLRAGSAQAGSDTGG